MWRENNTSIILRSQLTCMLSEQESRRLNSIELIFADSCWPFLTDSVSQSALSIFTQWSQKGKEKDR